MSRVLIVEDSPTRARELQLMLESEGFAADTTPDGQAGLGRLAGGAFDLVLADILLPGIDGYGASRELHLNPVTARVRLLALTGYGSDEDGDRSHQAGFDVHLAKPVDPVELQQHLVARGAQRIPIRG